MAPLARAMPRLLGLVATLALVLAPPAGAHNCSCTRHTDFQCELPTPPCADIGTHDGVNSSDACAEICLTDPRCYAAAWNGDSSDHWNQCYRECSAAEPARSVPLPLTQGSAGAQ